MGREGMPQHVRRNWFRQAGPPSSQAEHLPEGLPREQSAATRHEQESGESLFQQLRPYTFDIVMEKAPCRFTHRHEALFRALPRHTKIADFEIHMRGLDSNELGDTESRRVEQFQHHTVALILRCRLDRKLEQRCDLALGQRFWQSKATASGSDFESGILVEKTFLTEKSEPAPNSRQTARRGDLREVRRMK